jgi:hypothetical protein
MMTPSISTTLSAFITERKRLEVVVDCQPPLMVTISPVNERIFRETGWSTIISPFVIMWLFAVGRVIMPPPF